MKPPLLHPMCSLTDSPEGTKGKHQWCGDLFSDLKGSLKIYSICTISQENIKHLQRVSITTFHHHSSSVFYCEIPLRSTVLHTTAVNFHLMAFLGFRDPNVKNELIFKGEIRKRFFFAHFPP